MRYHRQQHPLHKRSCEWPCDSQVSTYALFLEPSWIHKRNASNEGKAEEEGGRKQGILEIGKDEIIGR